MQERCNSSALAMELHLSCTNPSKCTIDNFCYNSWKTPHCSLLLEIYAVPFVCILVKKTHHITIDYWYILQSDTMWYWVQYNSKKTRTFSTFWTQRKHPYLTLMGEVWDFVGDKWQQDIKSVVYKDNIFPSKTLPHPSQAWEAVSCWRAIHPWSLLCRTVYILRYEAENTPKSFLNYYREMERPSGWLP